MKKLISLVVIVVLVLSLSGCNAFPQDVYYTQEEVDEMLENYVTQYQWEYQIDDYNEDLVFAWELLDRLEYMESLCDNADTPDDIGGLGDTDCDEMIRWYADNWEELYDLLNSFDAFEDTIGNYLENNYYTKEEIDKLNNNE